MSLPYRTQAEELIALIDARIAQAGIAEAGVVKGKITVLVGPLEKMITEAAKAKNAADFLAFETDEPQRLSKRRIAENNDISRNTDFTTRNAHYIKPSNDLYSQVRKKNAQEARIHIALLNEQINNIANSYAARIKEHLAGAGIKAGKDTGLTAEIKPLIIAHLKKQPFYLNALIALRDNDLAFFKESNPSCQLKTFKAGESALARDTYEKELKALESPTVAATSTATRAPSPAASHLSTPSAPVSFMATSTPARLSTSTSTSTSSRSLHATPLGAPLSTAGPGKKIIDIFGTTLPSTSSPTASASASRRGSLSGGASSPTAAAKAAAAAKKYAAQEIANIKTSTPGNEFFVKDGNKHRLNVDKAEVLQCYNDACPAADTTPHTTKPAFEEHSAGFSGSATPTVTYNAAAAALIAGKNEDLRLSGSTHIVATALAMGGDKDTTFNIKIDPKSNFTSPEQLANLLYGQIAAFKAYDLNITVDWAAYEKVYNNIVPSGDFKADFIPLLTKLADKPAPSTVAYPDPLHSLTKKDPAINLKEFIEKEAPKHAPGPTL